MSFAHNATILNRRPRTRRKSAPAVACMPTRTPGDGKPMPPAGRGAHPDLADAAIRYAAALERSVRAGETQRDPVKTDAASERAGRAERRLLAVMRAHGIGACVVAGRLFIDLAALDADPDGQVGLVVGVLDVAEVRGI